jgi:hypothetical protein
VPALTSSPGFNLERHPVLFRTIGGADCMLATIVHVLDSQAICSGDIVYNNIHMWLWKSAPDSRKAWPESLAAVARLTPSTIITGHKGPRRRRNPRARPFAPLPRGLRPRGGQAGHAAWVIDAMLAKYPAFGSRYTLFASAFSQFPS